MGVGGSVVAEKVYIGVNDILITEADIGINAQAIGPFALRAGADLGIDADKGFVRRAIVAGENIDIGTRERVVLE